MALLHVNPTRMELTRLKRKLKTARRGHHLLKDKRDELMKQFMEHVRRNRDLRIDVEAGITEAYAGFRFAAAVMGPQLLEQTLMAPKQDITLTTSIHNVMSVKVPVYEAAVRSSDPGDNHPYGFLMTAGDLDDAILALARIQPDLLKLAELEKSTQMMAVEIERTRRRVNALEYVVIPQLTDTIRSIAMKLDENERGNITRLMKIKDLLLEQARKEAQTQLERTRLQHL